MLKLKSLLFFVLILLLSNVAYGTEIWLWKTNVTKVKTFNGSAIICLVASTKRGHYCFDAESKVSKEKFSMVLAARAS